MIELCRANSLGSRLKCAMQTVWDRDRGVPCKQFGIAIEVWIEVCRANSLGSR